MALTIRKNTNTIATGSSLVYPHSVHKQAYAVVSSTNSLLYIDFRYYFTITDVDGEIFNRYATPDKDGYGAFNVAEVVKSFMAQNLTPVAEVSTPIELLKEYQVTVQEYYDGALQGAITNFPKSLGGNLRYNENDSIMPFTVTNNRFGNFLTDLDNSKIYTQSTGTEASIELPIPSSLFGYDEVRYKILYKTPSSNVEYLVLYNIPISAFYNFAIAALQDSSEAVVKVPIGYGTLAKTYIHRLGYWDESDVWHTQDAYSTGVGTHLTGIYPVGIELYTSSSLDANQQGNYKWNITTDKNFAVSGNGCDNKSITIIWEGINGGLEFFNFNKVREDSISSKRKTYIHNSLVDYRNDLDKTNVSTYENIREYKFNVKSDLLSKFEIDYLKGLWLSDKVLMNIDGINYPITAITDKAVIPSKEKPSFVMYKFDVEYAKII